VSCCYVALSCGPGGGLPHPSLTRRPATPKKVLLFDFLAHEQLRSFGWLGVETIDSELRLVAALRRAARERGGPLPSIDVADALLDEHRELAEWV